MRPTRIAAIVVLSVWAMSGTAENVDLASQITQASYMRDSRVLEVRSLRQYTLRNQHWAKDATVRAVMITSADGKKRYEVVNMEADGLSKRILLKILDGEVEAAARGGQEGTVNSTNYELRLESGETPAKSCRKVELIPKRRTKYTFDGHGCVDMQDMAMVRMEGTTAKKVSFWIGKAYVWQEFRKIGDFWYASKTRSTADVRFLGDTEMVIDYIDYTIKTKDSTVLSSCRPAGSTHPAC